jgi:carbon monoxide dehydrogenase subunit G
MPWVEAAVELRDPPETVWLELEHVERHVEWMSDAERIEFIGNQQRGVGTTIRVLTKVGPFTTSDMIEFTSWEPPSRMAVSHRGLVSGRGEFVLEPIDGGTRFVWREELSFPWYLGGVLTAAVSAPILRRIWQRNLERFRSHFAAS